MTWLIAGFTRMYVHVVIAFFTGVTFWQVGNTALDLQNRIFVIFQATILPAMVMMQVEPRYDFSRLIFIRENSSKMYSQFAFVVAVVVAEIPYGIMAAVLVIHPCINLTCSISFASTIQQDSITALTEPATSFS
jgi:ATP-binding cassette, subfamily G (WHITE), member 2, SNQ2